MTLFSERYKCIVVTIPKTATRSITRFLRDECGFFRNKLIVNGQEVKIREHTPASEIKQIMGREYKNYTKIAIVRDPLDRVRSHHNFIQYKQLKKRKRPSSLKNKIKGLLTKITPFHVWLMFYRYYGSNYFLCDDQGKLLVDYLGYFDTLDPDFYRLLDIIGVDRQNKMLTHRNYNNGKKPFQVNEKLIFNKALLKDLEFYRSLKRQDLKSLVVSSQITGVAEEN